MPTDTKNAVYEVVLSSGYIMYLRIPSFLQLVGAWQHTAQNPQSPLAIQSLTTVDSELVAVDLRQVATVREVSETLPTSRA